MTARPKPQAGGHFDRAWLRTLAFTLAMVGLVTLAMGADRVFAAAALATCGVGFGFFYLLFATGAHFGLTMANGLAVYVCLFAYFREANFAEAPHGAVLLGFALPVVAFLAGCYANRVAIGHALGTRHAVVPTHLPRLGRWLPGLLLVGVTSFLLPRTALDATAQGWVLLAAMAAIGALVAVAARDVVLLLIDVATLIENVADRAHRLLMPVVAFLTYYALVIIVFACLYRIAEMALGAGQFRVHGRVQALSFAEALYFSVITMATVGYGDIVPDGALVRALAAGEVVLGVLLLLFGFGEIMRARDTVRPADPPRRRRSEDGAEE